jgi:hypothetical protein
MRDLIAVHSATSGKRIYLNPSYVLEIVDRTAGGAQISTLAGPEVKIYQVSETPAEVHDLITSPEPRLA